MIKCYGRSPHTYKMPDQPIEMGYNSLFSIMRGLGIVACATTQVGPAGPDFPSLIKGIKEHHSKNLPWSTTCAIVVRDILCLSWPDNNIITLLSTVHTVDKASDIIE
jgi:hypothetical protein